jgi:NAD(P)-dependent dehydrogenase (short-subunit alcohol dehydrogenase family)
VPRLAGKVALVTGGGGSIGGATARAFAAEGAKVVVADIDADGVERVVSDLGPDVAAGAVGDVTDSAAVAAAVQLAVERFGGLHVAFANAGVFGSHASVAEYPEDVFDQGWRSTSRVPSSSASTRWRPWATGPARSSSTRASWA